MNHNHAQYQPCLPGCPAHQGGGSVSMNAQGRSAIFGDAKRVESWVFRLQDLSVDVPLLPMLRTAPDEILRKIYDFCVSELKERGTKV